MFKESDSRRAAKDFWQAEVQNLETASTAVTKAAARALQREIRKQLRTFKKGPALKDTASHRSSGGFQKAVKIADKLPKGLLSPASIVTLGVPFMDAFEEGKTVTGKSNLIILLPPGEQLGFKRITKGNRWGDVWDRIQKQSRFVRTSTGVVVLFKLRGVEYPIYKFQKSVKDPKKISFYVTAEAIADAMGGELAKLLGNR